MKALRMMVVGVLVTTLGSCSDSTKSNTDAKVGPGEDAKVELDCQSRCEAKASACGAPQATGTQACITICAKNPTSSQLTCLEETDCALLASAFSGGQLPCGIGGSTGDGGVHDVLHVIDQAPCVPLGKTGCDHANQGPKCCALVAACEHGTQKCCLPSGIVTPRCTSSNECCTGLKCLADLSDKTKLICRPE